MKRRIACTLVLLGTTLSAQTQQAKIAYPAAKTVAHSDDYFGRKISDPYRWMEDLNSPDLASWVKAEDGVTERYLATLPMRDRFKSRLTELYNRVRISVPFREAGMLF